MVRWLQRLHKGLAGIVAWPSRKSADAAGASHKPVSFVRRPLRLALITALAPAWVFFLAYLHELGYTDEFHIDHGYIELSAASVASTSLRLLVLLVIAGLIVDTIIFGRARDRQFVSAKVMYAYVVFEALIVGIVVYWAASNFDFSGLAQSVFAAAVLGLLFFVFRDQTKGVIDSGYFAVVAGAIILAYAAYGAGSAAARHKKTFDVLDRDPPLVVLKHDGSRVITAPLLRGSYVAENSFIVLTLGDTGAQRFERRKLGRLHFVDP